MTYYLVIWFAIGSVAGSAGASLFWYRSVKSWQEAVMAKIEVINDLVAKSERVKARLQEAAAHAETHQEAKMRHCLRLAVEED